MKSHHRPAMPVRVSEYLRHTDGTPAMFAAEMRGAIYDDDGNRIIDFLPMADALARRYPFRSMLVPRPPAVITAIWVVPKGATLPPDPLLESLRAQNAVGNTILLLADDRETRDGAKAALYEELARWLAQ